MNGHQIHDEESLPRTDMPPRARALAVTLWCSFLVAAAATMVCFALIDPLGAATGQLPAWWAGRRTVYAAGFFFFWAIASAAAGLTLYMMGTRRP